MQRPSSASDFSFRPFTYTSSHLSAIGFQNQLLSSSLAARIGMIVDYFIWGVLIAPSEEGKFEGKCLRHSW